MDGRWLGNPLAVGYTSIQTNGLRTAFLRTTSNASTSFANPAATLARALTSTFVGIHPAIVPGFSPPLETLDRMAIENRMKAIGWEPFERL